MTPKKKQKPVWITIPEKNEATPAPKKNPKKRVHPDEVKNKFFWAMGFVAVLIFSFILAMPGTFTQLMKGDLFDGFQVVPSQGGDVNDAFFDGVDYEEVALDEASDAEEVDLFNEATTSSSASSSDAELIDISPISEPASNDEPESLFVEDVPAETSQVESGNTVSEEMQQLLADLNAQLAALRQDSLEKDQQIQTLMDQIESQASQHAAALAQQEEQLKAAATPLDPASNGVSALTAATGYKVNTHTVSMTPEEVLAQRTTQQVASNTPSLEANLLSAEAGALDQSQNAPDPMDLSGVNAQPTTGPMETTAFAFLLASLGVLGYTVFRRRVF